MRKQRLKLWVWDDVLADYTSGIAFAYAETAEDAIRLFMEEGSLADHIDGVKIDGVEPKCYDVPHCGFSYGGA